MTPELERLKKKLAEIQDLRAASALLYWDQATHMPPEGARARGQQLATLGKLAQERATDPELGELLDELTGLEQDHPYESDEASLVRIARRDYERAVRVPPEFQARATEHSSESYQTWTRARPADDFSTVRPHLERTLDLSREYAQFFPDRDHLADPLIADHDYGMTVAQIKNVFDELREGLVPIVEAISAQPTADRGPVLGSFPEADQRSFGEGVIGDFGYDFERGRQDKTHHPFMTRFSIGDVRITTRFKENDLTEGLFSTLHEAGHALYEQGVDPAFERTPLARGASSGMHESQSRLWENFVGRSLGFWQHYYPSLQETFPSELKGVPLQDFHRAVNCVERSLIRTDADEVTYNLHVMLRFDLELELLEGDLEVRHLPEAWRERYRADLGVAPEDDKDGVLQDVHWYAGFIGGAFQGYTLGNIIAGQIFAAAREAHPEIPSDIEQGKFDTLYKWLREEIYRHGRKFTANELVKRITGQELSVSPYLDYLRNKFGSLYGVQF